MSGDAEQLERADYIAEIVDLRAEIERLRAARTALLDMQGAFNALWSNGPVIDTIADWGRDLRAEIERLRAALMEIAESRPVNPNWSDSDEMDRAVRIARAALGTMP